MMTNYNSTLNILLVKLIESPLTKENLDQAYHLIKAGAHPNITGTNGKTILFNLVMMNHPDKLQMIEEFVACGCDIHTRDYSGFKPIDYASDCYQHEVVDWFLSHGIDIHEMIVTESRIHRECLKTVSNLEPEKLDKEIKLVEVFLKHGANLLITDNGLNKRLPLDDAIRANPEQPENKFVQFIRLETEKQEFVNKKKGSETNIKKEIEEMEKVKMELEKYIKKLKEDKEQIETEIDNQINKLRQEQEQHKSFLKNQKKIAEELVSQSLNHSDQIRTIGNEFLEIINEAVYSNKKESY
jgi:hypothetical protein